MPQFIEADVIQKIATPAEWATLLGTKIPYKGQIMLVSDSTGKVVNIKVGDGTNNFASLEYMFDTIQANVNYVPYTATPSVSNAFTIVGDGTYGSIVVPSGELGILFWDGTIWSLQDSLALPMQQGVHVINPVGSGLPTEKAVADYVDPMFGLTNKSDISSITNNALFEKNGWNITDGSSATSNNIIRLPYINIKPEWVGHKIIITGYGYIPTAFARAIVLSSTGTKVFGVAGKGAGNEDYLPVEVNITSAMSGGRIGLTVAQGTGIDPSNNTFINSYKVYLDAVPDDPTLKINKDKVSGAKSISESGVVTTPLIRDDIEFVNSIKKPSVQLLDNSKFIAGGYTNTGGDSTSVNLIRSPRIPVQDIWRGKNLTYSGYGTIPTGFNHVTVISENGTVEWSKAGIGTGQGTPPITFPITANSKEVLFTVGQATNVGLDPTNSPWKTTVILNAGDTSLPWVEYGNFIDASKIQGFTPGAENTLLFLPAEVPIALGRTIELYHNQILWTGAFSDYHFLWTGVGRKLARKLSIEPSSGDIGTHLTRLSIYDRNNNRVVDNASFNVKVVSNIISSVKKVLCIGDSLTRAVSGGQSMIWLKEIKNNLSANIQFVGTRTDPTDPTYRHEGRSGMSAKNYMENYDYQGDSNGINGNDGRTQNLNPFWNPVTQDVDFNYYISNYNVESPDIIFIWLGTNGNTDPATNANDIKTFIDKLIATGAAGKKIIVAHTLIWANQDGIAFQGSTDGFQSLNIYKLRADLQIFTLAANLRTLLKDYSDLSFCPLMTCHDSDNNYGAATFPLNPRSTKTTEYPLQAVHPVTEGYLQCADVIFSSICDVING